MRKSVSKRIRVTKNGKVLRRAMGVGHNRLKKSSKTRRNFKNTRGLNYSIKQ